MAMAYKVLIPIDISEGGKDYLAKRGYAITIGTQDEIDLNIVGDYEAILLRTSRVNEAVLNAAKKLKVIGRYGVGLDNIDLPAAEGLSIKVGTPPG
jgi:D-3-phosphoglycerate dehydrogenase